jgi:hypothetical protein
MADHFAFYREYLFAHLQTFYTIVSRSLNPYILNVNRPKFTMDFRSTHAFSEKKADDSANFAAGGISNGSTQHNSHLTDKNKH